MKYFIAFISFNLIVSISFAQTKRKELEKEIAELEKLVEMYMSMQPDIEDQNSIRFLISELPEGEKKKELYRKLQYQVEYKNQLANASEGESTCNLTSLSEVFAFMGIPKSPDDLNNAIKGRNALIEYKNAKTENERQKALTKLNEYKICKDKNLEECIKEQEKNIQKGTLNKLNVKTRELLASENGIKQKVTYPKWADGTKIDKDEYDSAKKIDAQLSNGNAVTMSVGGHIVRVVDVKKDKNGNPTEFIIDDSYGSKMDFRERKKYVEINNKIDSFEKKKIKTSEDKSQIEKLKKEKKDLAGNGYGCFANQSCERKNEKNSNSKKGKQVSWSIKELKDSQIGISYYEIYSRPN